VPRSLRQRAKLKDGLLCHNPPARVWLSDGTLFGLSPLRLDKPPRVMYNLVDEIEQSVLSRELLEDYPDDPRRHSCLILGFTGADRAIHTVWGLLPDDRVRVITVYIPRPPKWIDPRTRRRRDRNDV
jgi:hypothetical protein